MAGERHHVFFADTPHDDTADAIALRWIAKNPGKHGSEMPDAISLRLKSLEKRKLIVYSRSSGWEVDRGR